MWLGKLKTFQNTLVRYYSRKSAVNVRKINPKVPTQQAYSIAQSLYDIIREKGPLTVPNTWIHAKDAGIDGLNSKTHMKIMLKWMRGRKMLKLNCNQVGSSKKFFHSILPEEQPESASDSSGLVAAAEHNESKPNKDQGRLPAKPIGQQPKDGVRKVGRVPVSYIIASNQLKPGQMVMNCDRSKP